MPRFFLFLLFFILGGFIFSALPAWADTTAFENMRDFLGKIGDALSLGAETPSIDLFDIAGGVIKIFLSLMGTIFLGLMLYGGYLWMTAMGEAEKITKAKDTMVPAVIGLVIIVGSYSLVWWVIDRLVKIFESEG